jgi:uncharacterized membrane protein YeaQ/YmgE (transglycosylase-associated protein family)
MTIPQQTAGLKPDAGGEATIGQAPMREFSLLAEPDRSEHMLERVMPSLDQFIVWIIVGLLGGSLAGLMIRRDRKGFGLVRNLAVGLIGALVGGLLFRALGLFPGLAKVAISLRDVVAAVVGSLLVLAALWLWQRWKGSS